MARFQLDKTRYPGVYRRADGRLVVRIKVTSERTGKPTERMQVLPEGATLTEARQLAEQLREQARNPVETEKPPSLSVYCARWITRKVARGDWTEGSMTQPAVERIFRLHVLPELGAFLLDKITPHDLQGWMDRRLATAGKRSSVRTWWIPLKNLLSDAAAEYAMPDPTTRIKPPKGSGAVRGGKDMVLMPEQVRCLIDEAGTDCPDTWYPVIVLGFGSGARPSEILAVQVRDLDLSGDVGIWDASRHVVGTNVIAGTKQHEEGRRIYLDPVTTEILRPRWEQRQQEYGVEAYMFPGRDGRCLTQTGLWTWLQKACERLQLPVVSAKSFRQTYVTLAAINNVSSALTMEQVGHRSDAVHGIYRRVPEVARQEAATAMGNVIALDAHRRKVGTEVGTAETAEAKE